MFITHRRPAAALTAAAVLAAGLAATTAATPAASAAAGDVSWTDTFDGAALDERWSVVNPDPAHVSVSGGALRIDGQPGDTYQAVNTAKNIVVLDVPAGDFTATADVSAAVAKVYQGAGLIAWQDMDNYVRSGLTFVGSLSPSGTAIETDVESAATFSAVSFADRPASSAERLRLARVGDTLTSSFWDGSAWVTAGTTQVSFDTTQVGVYEDINYAADGGLYAELVRNRSFEFNTSDNASFTGLTAWQVLNRSGAGTTGAVVDDDARLNDMNRNHLRLTAAAAGDGVRNIGYNNGFAVKAGETYEGYLWARSTTAQQLTVRMENAAGDATVATASVALDGSDTWKKHPFTLTASTTTDAGRLAVLAGAPSVVGLDMVSLMPTDRWVGPVNGKTDLRKDLMEKVAAMDPTFLRFPGGCVTNVGTFRTYEESGWTDRRRTYQWKETIGPVEERPTNWNFWGYNQSYGIGYLEYFELAEDLDAEPLPVVSVGANGCGSTIPEMKDPQQIQRWVDDTVDLIEFANGGTDTEWGAKRAALGHPEPFGLEMIGLGNEENTTTFEANFPAFRDAIEARYPDIQIISNSGPDSSGARFDTLWDFNRAQDVDLVDEHYYRDPQWFLENHYRYDSYDREDPLVFLGEYASRGNTMYNALAEASYMTGLQRNADVVRLASYAPLLANESHVQWNPDAIWFDNDESWETPNWEVQKLFGTNVGDEVVPSTYDAPADAAEDITGGVFLSTWATAAAYDNVTVTSNESGETLFSDQFADASQWNPQSGTWGVSGGRYAQTSTTVTDARAVPVGAYDRDWSNYTLELDATKTAGSEGFLVGFGATGANNFYWWNIGGWNNTRSVLQRATGGSASELKALENKSLVTGQTYRVKVVVEGTHIELYLDGELQMEYDQPAPPAKVFQVVTRDERTGDLVAKVVNTSTSPVRTQVEVADAGVEDTATVTTLAGAPGATNTKAAPNTVKPRTREVSGIGESFTYEFPASSVTFIRMGTADAVKPVVDDLSVVDEGVNGWYADPATVRVSASDDRAVERLEVSVDDGAWTTLPGDTGEVRVRGDGVHTVEVRAVDKAGNVGEVRPLTVGIDATTPITKATLGVDRTVTLAAADAGAGVERVDWRIGDGPWTAYDAPLPVGDAATTVGFRSVDRLGNVEQPGTLAVPAKGAQLAATATAVVASDDPVRLGRTASFAVSVTGDGTTPAGTVTLVGDDGTLATATLADGRATLDVATTALGVGSHTLAVRYSGDAASAASQDTVTVEVAKASSRTRATVRHGSSSARKAVVVVKVSSDVEVEGRVKVTVRTGKKARTRTVTLREGRARLVLRGLRAGAHRITATYAGSADVAPSRDRAVLRVTRREGKN